jgi:hypothetical protein
MTRSKERSPDSIARPGHTGAPSVYLQWRDGYRKSLFRSTSGPTLGVVYMGTAKERVRKAVECNGSTISGAVVEYVRLGYRRRMGCFPIGLAWRSKELHYVNGAVKEFCYDLVVVTIGIVRLPQVCLRWGIPTLLQARQHLSLASAGFACPKFYRS